MTMLLCLKDILTHLDSCDLDDDDLMLDADGSEASSLFSGTKLAIFSPHSQNVAADSETRLLCVTWVLKPANSSDRLSLCLLTLVFQVVFDLAAAVSPVQMEAGLLTWLSGRGGSCAGEHRSLTTTARGDVTSWHVLALSCP